MKFGENLYRLRKNAKMSQEKLAEKIGVSRQSVSKWENGTAYPEMNRTLDLCKIFHCQLNDLVNDTILDVDSLDEEVKMSVVKFNKEKQRKLKLISKIISICSKVLQIITIIISAVMLISIFFIPSVVSTVGRDLEDIHLDEITSNTIAQVFSEHSKIEVILYAEIITICLIISVMIISFAMLYLSKLFKNISEGETPFTLDNLKYIKVTSILFIFYFLFPDCAGTLFQWITKIDLHIDYEITKIFYALIIACIYYIFDYGHQIQLDSKGKIYGDENE